MKFEFELVDGKVNVKAEGLDYEKLIQAPDATGLLGEGLQALQKVMRALNAAKQANDEEKKKNG